MALHAFPIFNAQKEDHVILLEYPSRQTIVYNVSLLEVAEISAELYESLRIEKQDTELTDKELSEVTLAIANLPFAYQTLTPGGSMPPDRFISILTLHAIRDKPVLINSMEVEPLPVLFITLSYPPGVSSDDAKGFLDFIKKKIECPQEIYRDPA